MTDIHPSPTAFVDVQAQTPALALSLSRVGVTDVEKVIRLRQDGAEQLFSARFECGTATAERDRAAILVRPALRRAR